MRMSALLASIFVLTFTGSASAQDWIEYINREDGFRVDFPGQPRCSETSLDVGVRLLVTRARI